jgi:hypothetical protein
MHHHRSGRGWGAGLADREIAATRSLEIEGEIAASSTRVSRMSADDTGRAKNLTETGISSDFEVLHSSATGAKSAPVPP